MGGLFLWHSTSGTSRKPRRHVTRPNKKQLLTKFFHHFSFFKTTLREQVTHLSNLLLAGMSFLFSHKKGILHVHFDVTVKIRDWNVDFWRENSNGVFWVLSKNTWTFVLQKIHLFFKRELKLLALLHLCIFLLLLLFHKLSNWCNFTYVGVILRFSLIFKVLKTFQNS